LKEKRKDIQQRKPGLHLIRLGLKRPDDIGFRSVRGARRSAVEIEFLSQGALGNRLGDNRAALAAQDELQDDND